MQLKNSKRPIKAYIFITCLVDTFFPEVGESMVKILRELGVDVDFLEEQTCCGQPAYNSGYQEDSRAIAERFLSIFDKALNTDLDSDNYVICPSGSCTSMVKVFYQALFNNSPELLNKVDRISKKTFEFSDFLINVLETTDVGAGYGGIVTYHDSCHMLRELGVKDAPRELIKSIKGLEFREMDLHDACCGFGGTFSIKFPHVSVSMLDEKIECLVRSEADTLVSSDMGCLMNIQGALTRRNIPIKVMHLAQLLAKRGKNGI